MNEYTANNALASTAQARAEWAKVLGISSKRTMKPKPKTSVIGAWLKAFKGV